jgi:hypothetical protein
LDARFPEFGGLEATGIRAGTQGLEVLDVFVVGDASAVVAEAQRLAGDAYKVVGLPANHSYREITALKARIESEKGDLAQHGVQIRGTGIRVIDGPRVLLVVADDTAAVQAELVRRYGSGTMAILDSGMVTVL